MNAADVWTAVCLTSTGMVIAARVAVSWRASRRRRRARAQRWITRHWVMCMSDEHVGALPVVIEAEWIVHEAYVQETR